MTVHPKVIKSFHSVGWTHWPHLPRAAPLVWLKIHIVIFYYTDVITSQSVDQIYFFPILSAGPGCLRPSSHVQGFEGNNVSITEHGQPAQTHEERLGHPPN